MRAKSGTARHWALFADWCTATGRASLPAAPATVAAFAAELPAGSATLARRLRAIDAAHLAAGLPRPSDAPRLDPLLGRPPTRPRFDPARVAAALEAIPVGGWPAGIVGRRDAAVVALICSAGLTRAQIRALRTGTDPALASGRPPVGQPAGEGRAVRERGSPSALLEIMARVEEPGACPACALTRWLRVASRLGPSDWRSVRAELADYGESPAGAEAAHDCARPVAWPAGQSRPGSPLFSPIDRHGTPQVGWPLSTRSITAIIATRLSLAHESNADWRDGPADHYVIGSQADGHRWRVEDRRQAAARYAEVETTLDEIENEAEAILARVQLAMGGELEGCEW